MKASTTARLMETGTEVETMTRMHWTPNNMVPYMLDEYLLVYAIPGHNKAIVLTTGDAMPRDFVGRVMDPRPGTLWSKEAF